MGWFLPELSPKVKYRKQNKEREADRQKERDRQSKRGRERKEEKEREPRVANPQNGKRCREAVAGLIEANGPSVKVHLSGATFPYSLKPI